MIQWHGHDNGNIHAVSVCYVRTWARGPQAGQWSHGKGRAWEVVYLEQSSRVTPEVLCLLNAGDDILDTSSLGKACMEGLGILLINVALRGQGDIPKQAFSRQCSGLGWI